MKKERALSCAEADWDRKCPKCCSIGSSLQRARPDCQQVNSDGLETHMATPARLTDCNVLMV